MKRYFTIILVALFTYQVCAQNCSVFMPLQEGQKMEYTNYNHKDKVQGKTETTVMSRSESAQGISASIKSDVFLDEEKSATTEYELQCKKGVLYMDMDVMIPENTFDAFKNMEIKIDGDLLEFPTELNEGDRLKDATMNISVAMQGMPISEMKMNITNRTVEKKEQITTPAGPFDCVKISYNVVSEIGSLKMSTKTIQWYSDGIGMVKSEEYDKNGKLQGYSLLTKLTH